MNKRCKPANRIGLLTAALGAAVATPLLTGCQRALFPEDEPRTQFEAHDRLRYRYTPLEEPDAFGHPRPALRARLSQTRG